MNQSFFNKSCPLVVALLVGLLAYSAGAQEQSPTAHHGFGDTAKWAKAFESPERAEWQKPDKVVSSLDLKPGEVVIDIGAGTGYFTRRFARAVAPSGRAIGLDIEPGMVAYMRDDAKKLKLQNYEAGVVKPGNPELAANSANLIFFCDVLHHIDDRVPYLEKLAPALKPGGRIAVIDFRKSAPKGPPAAMKISRSEMISQFKQAGFRLLAERNFLPYQYFLEFEPSHGKS
jgi:arsenite methyltransferase